jgi:hypothetical protein
MLFEDRFDFFGEINVGANRAGSDRQCGNGPKQGERQFHRVLSCEYWRTQRLDMRKAIANVVCRQAGSGRQ